MYNTLPFDQFQPGATVHDTDYYLGLDTTDIAPSHPRGVVKKYLISQLDSHISGNSWVIQTTTPVNTTINTGYTSSGGSSTILFYLPTVAPVGSFVEITGEGTGLYSIGQAAGQQIHFGTASTSIGVSGEVDSVDRYSNIKLRCIVEGTTWTVVSFVGNFVIL